MDTAALQTALDRIIAGEYASRLDENTVGDELRPLASRINAALAALEERGASHQEELTVAAALKRQFTQMIQDNPLAIAVLRADKSRIDINDEYARMWRGTREETLQKKLYDYDITVIGGDDFYACYETKKRARTDVLAKWPDGVQKYLTLNAIPILDGSGEIEIAFYVWNDWTEQHDKEEEVTKAQQRVDTMIQDNPLAIAVLRADKSRIDINDEYARMWRGTREETMAKKLYDYDITVIGGDDFYACYETKKRARTDVLAKWPDGVQKYLTLNAIPILDGSGEIEMAFYVWNDWTEQQNLVDEAQQKAAYMDQEVNRLAGNLNLLAAGNLEFDLVIAPADERTEEIRQNFVTIAENLAQVRNNVGAMIDDAEMLVEAAMFGRLTTRADAAKHEGGFRTVVEGVNKTLDAIVHPIDETIRVSQHYAQGDFSERFTEKLKVAGEFQKLKEALDNIGVQVSTTLGEINQAIVQVEDGTAETSKGSEEIAKAAEQVSSTSQQCADLARQVLDQIEDIDRQLADLSASNEEIASTSQDVLERAQNTASQGKQAQSLGDEANQKMKIVEGIARQSVEEIEGLNAQMREINNIVKLITDIANQVNLLALNAAIEAARAGEHGRGFAVVAGEVRNLAGEAKGATQHIEKVIGGIQTSSEKTASAITSAHAEIGAGVASVTKTIEALHTIISEADVVAHGLGEIARATEDQANSTNKVVQGMAEGTRLTKETQNQMDDLAALAEEASASTEEIGSAAHEINQMAGELRSKMQRFRI